MNKKHLYIGTNFITRSVSMLSLGKALPGTLVLATVALAIMSLPVMAAGAKSTTIGSLNLSQRSMDLSIRERQFDAQFTTLEVVLARSFRPYFISLSYEISINTDISNNSTGLIFYDRQDVALTAGRRLLPFMTVFTGYRQGVTDSQYYDGTASNGEVSSRGGFIGSSFDYVVGSEGVLSASIAVAQLTGEVTVNEPFVTSGATLPETVDGVAVGFSYGLRWAAALSKVTSYSAQLRIHRYTFEDQTVSGGIDLSYDENFTSISIGLTHNF